MITDFFPSVCQKVANYLSDVLEEHQDKLDHYLRAGEGNNYEHYCNLYLIILVAQTPTF